MMNKALFTVVCLLGFSSFVQASDTLEIDAGILYNATGTSLVPQGGLLQLIASPSGANGTFPSSTAASFVSGDNIVVASFAMNYNSQAGETDSQVTFTLQNTGTPTSTTFDAGDALLLRWYPTLTLASTAPGVGTTYGQYRSNTGESDGGTGWFAPADGTVLGPNGTLYFNTVDAGGSNPETAGYASNIVATVPEPSSYAFLASVFVGWIGLRIWKQRGKTMWFC